MNKKISRSEYIEISLGVLKHFGTDLHFDIFVQRSKDVYTKIFKKGDAIDWQRLKSYVDKGIKFFYVTEEDYNLYALYVERLGENLNENNITKSSATLILKELAQYTIHELVVNFNIDERVVSNASNVVDGCINSLSKDPSSLLKIIKLLSNQAYILKHSVMVSMFSVILGKASGMEGEQNLKLLGLGGFLHDVGVGQLTFDPENEKLLSPEQRKEMWRHPELGKQMLDGIKGIRTEVSQIVLQHHEQPNGAGYPNGLRGPEIYHLAKIVAIADTFAAMITKRTFREAFTISETLTRMNELNGKFDKKLLAVFTKTMLPRSS